MEQIIKFSDVLDCLGTLIFDPPSQGALTILSIHSSVCVPVCLVKMVYNLLKCALNSLRC